MGIHVNSEDYGISNTCYPYTPILILLLQTSLSLSYLLHNSMSQDLFGEASKHRNKKQEEKRKFQKIGREISLMISSTLSIYSVNKLYQFLETGTLDRSLICIVQRLRFLGLILYSLSFFLYSPFKLGMLHILLRILYNLRRYKENTKGKLLDCNSKSQKTKFPATSEKLVLCMRRIYAATPASFT